MADTPRDKLPAEDEIILSSGASSFDTLQFEVPETEPTKINYKYVQVIPIKGITHNVILYNDIYLNETFKGFRKKGVENRRVDLTYLDPSPERNVYIDWGWFYAALGATAWAFVMIYIGVFTDFTIANNTMLPYGILLGTFGLVAFLIFFYRSHDKLVYKSYIGRVPMFEIFNKPKQDDFKKFINQLKKHIRLAQTGKGLNMQQRLSGEVKELRRQVDEGRVGNADYEQARTRIFKHESFSNGPGTHTN